MGLKKSQVYNADESAIFVKLLASRSVVLSNEHQPAGRKLNKMRYTFMPCSNVDGSNKLKLMFIGTAAKPRSFPDKDKLPVSYYSSKKAWMTRDLFKSWFYNEFVPAVREFSNKSNLEPKALLLLENCTAHYDGGDDLVSDDGLIKVIYLPPNVTSECQPMDQSVINAVKMRYKRKLMLRLVLEDEDLKFEDRLKKVSLLHSIDWLATAWNEIGSSTIENSWKKLIPQFPDCEWISANTDETDSEKDMRALVAAVNALAGTVTSDEEVNLWLTDRVYDENRNPAWLTSVVYTDDEILDSVLGESGGNISPIRDIADDSNDTQMDMSSTLGQNHLYSDFNHAIKSVDFLISFMQHDAAEIVRLKSLRAKIVEDEWQKQNL
ncbi:jerky protein homolog-like [Wyeomyia smithii]|uniref:jerky protein homolog-like n=1 Tax=Wyeomyia smithii TaxID=174621 RepID=UPI002467D817|nr:jerky protein homolog-like [Wyeomyia smithii]